MSAHDNHSNGLGKAKAKRKPAEETKQPDAGPTPDAPASRRNRRRRRPSDGRYIRGVLGSVAGAKFRISAQASRLLSEIVHAEFAEVASRAADLAAHVEMKTVQPVHIAKAVELHTFDPELAGAMVFSGNGAVSTYRAAQS